MRDIAEKPHTTVLEYTYAEDKADPIDPGACHAVAKHLFEVRRSEGMVHLPDVEAGYLICSEYPLLKRFSDSHPRIFSNMLNKEIGVKCLVMLEKLVRVRREADARCLSEQEALVHANRLIMEGTLRSPTDTEKDTLVFS